MKIKKQTCLKKKKNDKEYAERDLGDLISDEYIWRCYP